MKTYEQDQKEQEDREFDMKVDRTVTLVAGLLASGHYTAIGLDGFPYVRVDEGFDMQCVLMDAENLLSNIIDLVNRPIPTES